jgi:hypothetical protein
MTANSASMVQVLLGKGALTATVVMGGALWKAAEAFEKRSTDQTAGGAGSARSPMLATALGTVIGGPVGALIGSFVDVGLGVAGNLISNRVASRNAALTFALNDPATMKVSPAVARFVADTIRQVLETVEPGDTATDELRRLGGAAADHYLKSATSVAALGLTEDDVSSFFANTNGEQRLASGPTKTQWAVFLAEAADRAKQSGSKSFSKSVIDAGADALTTWFTSMLASRAETADPQTFAGLELMLLRAVTTALAEQGKKLDRIESLQHKTLAELEDQQYDFEKLKRSLSDLPDRLSAALASSLDPAIRDLEGEVSALRTSIPAAIQPLDGHLAAVLAQQAHLLEVLTPALADFAEHPWMPKRRSRVPFHFSLATDEESLYGDVARHEVRSLTQQFLDAHEPFLWWMWTGREGAGKSRLAMHACQRAIADGWKAGFVTPGTLNRRTSTLSALRVDCDTLVVIDDVAIAAATIRDLLASLDELARRAAIATDGSLAFKIRVLLLERFSRSLSPGRREAFAPEWVETLFHDRQSFVGRAPYLDLQFPEPDAETFHIRDLDRADAEALATECVRAKLARADAPHEADPVAVARIARRTIDLLSAEDASPQLRPLHVQITATMLAGRSGESMDTFDKVMRAYLVDRVARRRDQLAEVPQLRGDVNRIVNLVCVATVLRRILLRDIHPWPSWFPDIETARVAARVLKLGGTERDDEVRGIQPDLVGEWFAMLWCDGGSLGGTMTPSELIEAIDAVPDGIGRLDEFVQRTYRPFSRTEVWQALRNRLGRYSTPFGRIFDSEVGRRLLFGDSTTAAHQAYVDAIEQAVARLADRPDRRVFIIDLMAGGSSRLEAQLAGPFGRQLAVLAIDRDDARLLELAAKYPKNLKVARAEIQGTTDLAGMLGAAWGRRTCHIVVARKALHELPWEDQTNLIAAIGRVVTPSGGQVILYADSPAEMDDEGRERWEGARLTLCDTLKEIDADRARSAELLEHLSPSRLRLEPDSVSDHAFFANLWTTLKDWSNGNDRELKNRYFSSRKELLDAFDAAGFAVDVAAGARIERFGMRLDPGRFMEYTINRLGYLASDPEATVEQLQDVLRDNWRHELFRSVVTTHLWDVAGSKATPFGASRLVDAKPSTAFDPVPLLEQSLGDRTDARIGKLKFPTFETASFEFPVHIMVLPKVKPLT